MSHRWRRRLIHVDKNFNIDAVSAKAGWIFHVEKTCPADS